MHRPTTASLGLVLKGGSPACPHPASPNVQYPNWTEPYIHLGVVTNKKEMVLCQYYSCKIWLLGAEEYLGLTQDMFEKRFQTELVVFDDNTLFVAGGRLPGIAGPVQSTFVTEMLDLQTKSWTRVQVRSVKDNRNSYNTSKVVFK